jgi:hypothetical protein
MDNQDWKDFKKKGDIIRKSRLERHKRVIYRVAIEKDLSCKALLPTQIRISDHKTEMDLFPMSKRYHNITTNRRGGYHNITGFLYSVFGNGSKHGSK